MDILQINKFHYIKGGAERYYFEVSDLLESHGHSVVHFSMQHPANKPSPFSKFFVSNLDFDILPSVTDRISSAGRIIYSLEARKKLELLLSRFRTNIAHLHNIYHQLSPSILHTLKQFGVPAVLTAHDYKLVCPSYLLYCNNRICERCAGGRYYHALFHRCLKGSFFKSGIVVVEMYLHRLLGSYDILEKIIAPSRFIREKIIETGFPAHKVVTVPNFVPRIPEDSSGEPGNYVAYVGRLSREKGLKTLITAAAGLDHTEVKIAGDGPERGPLEHLCHSLGAQNVSFVGRLGREDLERFIRNASLVVIPSDYYENCPLSILETMVLGRPVIGAAVGGIPELIEDGADGLLFTSGDPVDLRESIAELVQDSKRLKRMGRRAREKIVSKYDRETHYELLMSVYESVAGGSST